jgi:signal transduction histidine kinase
VSDMSDEPSRRPGHIYDPAEPLPEHLRTPGADASRNPMKDTDAMGSVQLALAVPYGILLGILGMLVGVGLAKQTGGNVVVYAVIGAVVGAVRIAFAFGAAERAGQMVSRLYMPSGSSTPPVRQYSLADSLITRERFDDAVAELMRAAAQYPADPEPRLRLARLYRDRLQRHDDAVHWFRQALAVARLDAATEIAATRELVEVYTHHMKTPRRALTDLARMAERHPGTPSAEWARREMAEIREQLRSQEDA